MSYLVNQLKLSEGRFRAMFDQAAIGVSLCDSRNGKYVNVNTGFSEAMSEEKAASLGIKNVLLKPIVMKDLAQKNT